MRAIERQVIAVLRWALSRPADELIDQADAMEGYIRTPQDMEALRHALESDFQLKIPAADVASWRYVGNVVDYVVSRRTA